MSQAITEMPVWNVFYHTIQNSDNRGQKVLSNVMKKMNVAPKDRFCGAIIQFYDDKTIKYKLLNLDNMKHKIIDDISVAIAGINKKYLFLAVNFPLPVTNENHVIIRLHDELAQKL